MEYLGIVHRDYFQGLKDKGIFYTHLNNSCEVIIIYDRDSPRYLINQIGVMLKKYPNYNDSIFTLWDCFVGCDYENDCKRFGQNFAKTITSFLKDALKYFGEK